MSNKIIAGTATGATALPTASTIDGVNDYLPIYTANVTATQAINRNTLLNIVSQPLGLTDVQSPTNKTFNNTNSLTIKDGGFTLQNTSDTTKQGLFSLSNVTTSTTRTYTLPNASVTLASLTGTETLTNKTLTSPTINSATIANPTLTIDTINGYTTSTNVTAGGVTLFNGAVGGTTGTFSGLLTAQNGFTLSSGTLTLSNNSIQANALATTAISLGYAQITGGSFTTTSSTAVQVTGLTLTVTIPAGGRKIRITAFTSQLSNATATKFAFMSIWDGVVGSGTQISNAAVFVTPTAGTGAQATAIAIVTPAAGSKTYNVGLASDSTGGTANIAATTTAPAFILVEAI